MIMHFLASNEIPEALLEKVELRCGSKRIIFLFIMTLVITVSGNITLELPPAAGIFQFLSE